MLLWYYFLFMSSNREHIGPHYDVIVIGGGPSGMMAAGTSAENGRRVLLLEKNKQLGKKLDITGGGRCNILHAEEDTRALLAHYGEAAKFLFSPFSQFAMQDARAFFEKRGVPIVVQARKRAFPASQKATDVTRALKEFVTKNGVTLHMGTRFVDFILNDEEHIVGVRTSKGSYSADSFVLATGGSAQAQQTGASSDAVSILRDLGHTVHDPSPNIVPLQVSEQWVKDISGVTLSFMKITFCDPSGNKKKRFSRTGKLLFTHFGLSGPLILNASHQVQQLLKNGSVRAFIDLYPDTEVNILRKRVLEEFNIHKNKELRNVLQEFVPKGMAPAVAAQFPESLLHMRVHSVSREARHALVDRMKAMPLTITGTMGLDWAVISDGGVDLTEVDTRTMRSKKKDNLFFTGDVLHINRPSGGFSLQLCWTTGYVAGKHV